MKSERASAWAALPDGITAAAFALVWLSPFALGEFAVKTALLVMLVEFFLIHATGFFTAIGGAPGIRKRTRVLSLLGLSLFYVLMISALALSFDEWWPLLAFCWLAVGKIAWVLGSRAAKADDAIEAPMLAWGGSVAAYLLGCFLTVLAPVPRLGMTQELQPGFGLDGGGLWLEEPHRVVAFGLLYFGLLCAGKLFMARPRKP